MDTVGAAEKRLLISNIGVIHVDHMRDRNSEITKCEHW
jgi:hypothetical protein